VADVITGKLVWQGTGDKRVRRIVFPTKRGMSIPTPFDSDQLATSLQNRTEDEIEVHLELRSGKPIKIRPVGESFSPPSASQVRPPQSAASPRGQHGSSRPQSSQKHSSQSPVSLPPAFHNPYNFVPAPPRNKAQGDLGDQRPTGHHVYHPERYTGVIRVKMTANTPLLVPDAARVKTLKQDHKTFPVRVDAEGKPFIPPTSIKGMLRSAYEAVTNSRLAVFPGHKDRLAYRMPARDGLALVPARIVVQDDQEKIELLPGNLDISQNEKSSFRQGKVTFTQNPMFAAWLPRYDRQTGEVDGFAIRYPDGELPQHGEAVRVWLELWEKSGQHPFRYWKVRKCVRLNEPLGQAPEPGKPRGIHHPITNEDPISVKGYVCITNRNIDRKHDERVFFTTRDEPILHPLTDDLRQQWRELIANYQSIHEEEIRAGDTGPPALENSVWSRHVVGGPNEQRLDPGTLCYAAFRDGKVTALYPVMISRRLFESSPLDLLPQSLRSATSLMELSPADRVFGWVNQEGQGAYKGQLRVGPVTCATDDAIERFGQPGLPLAILGQPKPQQARFYVAASRDGEAQQNGLSKDDVGYTPKKGLRGRKVYPHHAGLPQGHWDNPMEEDRTQTSNQGHFQEYRRPRHKENRAEQRDNQNRSIQGWIKPGTEFHFDLHVTNLSKVELGALLWLLHLPKDHFHRFGGGKPLGFGSVRLEIDPTHTRLDDGHSLKQFYSSLESQPDQTRELDWNSFIKDFQEAVVNSYPPKAQTPDNLEDPFKEVSFIAAWLRMATGHTDSLPTHYPRARQKDQRDSVPPNPEGLAYEWFVANDRTGRDSGPQVCLPDLASDYSGLPMLESKK